MAEVDLRDDHMCFACGKRNADGLKLEFTFDCDEVATSVAFPKKFQGYRDVVHGGLLSTVLDEAMVTLINMRGRLAVTAELNVRFLKPLPVESPLEVRARLTGKRGKVYEVEAEGLLPDGTEVAKATARCIDMGPLPAEWLAARQDAGSP